MRLLEAHSIRSSGIPNKVIAAAATQHIDAFLASAANRNRPQTTEVSFFSRYVSEDNLVDLTWHLSAMPTPKLSQRAGDKAIVIVHIHRIAAVLKPFAVAPTDPMSAGMCERGKLAREAFENVVDVLRTWGADRACSRVTRPERYKEAASVISPHKGAKSAPAGPTKVLGRDDARLSATQRSIDELRNLFLSSHDR